jgi:hypothetical protein
LLKDGGQTLVCSFLVACGIRDMQLCLMPLRGCCRRLGVHSIHLILMRTAMHDTSQQCLVTATGHHMYDIILTSVAGEPKLLQGLSLSCDEKKLVIFVYFSYICSRCDSWNDKHAAVYEAITKLFCRRLGALFRNEY